MQKYRDVVLTSNGSPLRGASVYVTLAAGGVPTIYSDNGVTVASNPLTTDTNGAFSFYAADGRYTLTISMTGIATQTITDILLEDPTNGSATVVVGGSVDASPIGSSTPSSGAFTTLSASSSVSGTGFVNYMASPPAIGGTAPNTGKFTNLTATGSVSSAGFYTQSIDYAEVRMRATSGANLNGWRLASGINGASDGTLTIQHSTDNFAANFTNAIVADASGNVGIGAVSSGYKLQVNAAVASVAMFYQSTAATPTDIYINNVGSANNFVISRRSNGESWFYNSGADPFVFTTNATERMRIDSSGNVGIGAAPATKLDCFNSGTADTIAQIRNGTTSVQIQAGNGFSYINTYTAHPMLFGTGNAERMRIDSSGNVGIGGSPGGDTSVQISSNIGGATTAYGVRNLQTIQPAVTSNAFAFISTPSTATAAFTLANLKHFSAYQGAVGSGSSITNQFGFVADSGLTGATNNYGFYSSIPSGSGRYNFYAAGTAQNIFNGDVLVIGGSAGLGYGTGAGGTVTQATSKSTAVTLNKPTGQITMNGAALASLATVGFTLNNSLLAATDVIILTVKGGTTSGAYEIWADTMSPGACNIWVKNLTGGSLSEVVVINFAVIKGATA